MTNRTTLTQTHKLYKELHRAKARTDYASFVQYCWQGHDFQIQPFQRMLAAYVEALIKGRFKKMFIAIPPQHGKTTFGCDFSVPFAAGLDSSLNAAICGYSQGIANKSNAAIQSVMRSPEYQEVFDTRIGINGLKANTDLVETNGGGKIKTVGIGGALTGFRVDFGIIDDPFKGRLEANSQTIRNHRWEWYQDVFKTRMHNDSKELMFYTRWHEDDLIGRILNKDSKYYNEAEARQWVVIALPAIKEATPAMPQCRKVRDDRAVGEALWPARHSAEKYEIRKRINPTGFASMDQQRPSAEEGNKIRGEWFNIMKANELPFNSTKVTWDCFIDGAWTEKVQNDETALLYCYFDKTAEILYIRNCMGVRKELYKFLQFFAEHAPANGITKQSSIFIELKASGRAFKSFLTKGGYKCRGISEKAVRFGKFNRVENAEPTLASGKVVLVEGNWNAAFIEQCKSFPNGKHDDMVDVLTYAINEYFIKDKPRRIFYD